MPQYDPLTGELLPDPSVVKTSLAGDSTQQSDNSLPTPVELSRLDSMSREELIDLVKRMACQCGLSAAMTDEETAQAMLDTLAETALKPIVMGINVKADIQSRMNAIDKWLDRKKGKPVQSLDMNVKDTRLETMAIDKLIRLAAMLDEPIIIPPMPLKDNV